MSKLKTLKGIALVAATSMLPLSQAAMAEVTISGWINEGMTFYDDGDSSDAVQLSDNGTTLGSRITFAASSEVATGITAGMEVILEPESINQPLIFSNQNGIAGVGSAGPVGDTTGDILRVLGSSLHVGGSWGKITAGLQSMPTDNIAVLEDPSLTLWSGISPVFRGNGFNIKTGTLGGNVANNSVWGDFLECKTAEGLSGVGGIGIDCNGIYRNGVRYDLPAFGPVTVAVGYANDDVYDIAAKYKGDLGGLKAQLAMGYAVNNGTNGTYFKDAEMFALQAGLMHPATGLFGSIAYQSEDSDLNTGVQAAITNGGVAEDSTDAWWLKVGIKKQWFSLGDTSLSFDYGQYNDQYGQTEANSGVTGSEVERMGFAVDQYFGSSLIIYGVYRTLSLDVDGVNANTAANYGSAEDLDIFTLGATYFF